MADLKITGLTAATTPVDADLTVLVQDVATTPVTKKITWTVIKAFLKTYFDTLYPSGSGTSTGTNTGDNSAASPTVSGIVELAIASEIDTGTDTTRAMPVDQFVASTRNVRYVLYRILEKATATTVSTTVGGDLEFPFTGTITEVGAFVDTAGTTNLTTVDINKAGTTILSTKITIDSTKKSSRTAATAPVISVSSITAGDVLTFDLDAIQTTAALGLTIRIGVRMS